MTEQAQGLCRSIATVCVRQQTQYIRQMCTQAAYSAAKSLHVTDLAQHSDQAILLRKPATGQAGVLVLDMRSHRPDLPQIHHH